MSVWFRRGERPSDRTSARADSITLSQFASLVVGGQGYANVDGSRIEEAQQSVAIASAVDLVASIVSELPLDIYQGKGAQRKEKPLPSWLEDPAGDGYGIQDWLYKLIYSWCYRGNAFGDILSRSRETAGQGFITQMDLHHPDRVRGEMVEGKVQWYIDGQQVTGNRMYHRRVNPVPGQILGQSPISRNRIPVGISLAATRFGKSFFDSDANPTGILRNTLGQVDADRARTIKDRFMAALRGNREPIVMGRGWEWQSISITPEESQFLQTMGWSEAQCARLFGPGIAEILGYETGGGMTYANVQDRDITLLKYAVGRWIRRAERVLYDMLPKPQYAIFNRDALLETNTLQRYQAYALALAGEKWETVDEVRELENMPPLPEEEKPDPADPNADDPDIVPDDVDNPEEGQ
jgi:HK97 family phage portal protein